MACLATEIAELKVKIAEYEEELAELKADLRTAKEAEAPDEMKIDKIEARIEKKEDVIKVKEVRLTGLEARLTGLEADQRQAAAQAHPGPGAEPWMIGVITKARGQTTWVYHERASTFANELRDVQPIQMMPSSILVFPITTSFDFHDRDSPKLILRPRVQALWDQLALSIAKKQHSFTVVTGNPGIGKTRSMEYLLRLFLLEEKLVFYEQSDEKGIYVFVPPSIHKVHNIYRVYYTKSLVEEETWLDTSKCDPENANPTPVYLLNPPHLSNSQTHIGSAKRCHLVIAASPNPKVSLDNAYKIGTYNGKLIMPSWTLPELLACAEVFNKKKEDIISGFCRYGGIVRPIVGEPAQVEEYEEKLLKGPVSLPLDAMETMLAGDNIGALDSKNVHIPSGLYRVEPISDDFQKYTTTFASPYTCALVAKSFWTRVARQGRGSDRRYTAWFELLCMLVLSQGGSFPTRRLMSPKDAASETSTTLTLSPSNLVFMTKNIDGPTYAENVESVDDSMTDTQEDDTASSTANEEFYNAWASNQAPDDIEQCILAPRTTNLPVVDCVSLPHPRIDSKPRPRGFQVTVSRNHPLSHGESVKILEALFPDDVHEKECMDLYFVVPEHLAGGYTRQYFKGGAGAKLHPRITQHVIGITVHHIANFEKLYYKCVNEKLAWFMEDFYPTSPKRSSSEAVLSDPQPKRPSTAAEES